MQVFAKKDLLGEDEYNTLKTHDIVDIIGVKVEIFKTKMGEVSIRATEVLLLSKSLQNLSLLTTILWI
jgi:lysyl-tRNA synthetase class 2